MSLEHPRDQKISTTFAVLITTDTRTEKTDVTGKIALQLIKEAGHKVKGFSIVPNNEKEISKWLKEVIDVQDVRVIITSGGTGIGANDKTVDTVRMLIEKELQGFGEYFRRLSLEEVGLSGIWSRATAGIINGKIIFSLPGSSGAMKSALNRIILPGLGHMLWELNRT